MSSISTYRFTRPRLAWGKPALAVVGALALGACATMPMPKALQGNYASLSPKQAAQGGANGTRVRWGGQIMATTFKSDVTCFYVLSRPLNSAGRPFSYANTGSYFQACHSGIYNPTVYVKGRNLTFIGTVQGVVSKKGRGTYPHLDAKIVYLWPMYTSGSSEMCGMYGCNTSTAPITRAQAQQSFSQRNNRH